MEKYIKHHFGKEDFTHLAIGNQTASKSIDIVMEDDTEANS